MAKAYQSTTYTLAEVDTAWSAKAKQAIAYVNTEVDTELAKTAHVSDMTAAWNAQTSTSTRCTSTQVDDIYIYSLRAATSTTPHTNRGRLRLSRTMRVTAMVVALGAKAT